MQTVDVRKLQLMELQVLNEVRRICDKHQISWFLVGGSVLGAARHQGFIPWDDDVDLGMYRPDYERFLAAARDELSDRYFLQTLESDPGYHLGYAKIRVNGTRYVQENVMHRTMHQGVFVDIYPIDGVPDDPKLRKKQRMWALLSYFFCRQEPIKKQGQAIKLASTVLTKVLPKTLQKKIGMAYDRKISRFPVETCRDVANIYGIKQYYNEIMPKEYIGAPVMLEFEGSPTPVPEQWDNYLTFLYGDYHQLPPEDQRVLKHQAVEFSLGEETT